MYELGTRERQAIGREFVEIIFYTSYPEDIMDMRSFDRRNFVQPRSIMEIGTPPIGRRTPPIGHRLDVAADWTLRCTSDPKIRDEDS